MPRLLLTSALLWSLLAHAADTPTISRAWSRATPPGVTVGVVYLTIDNPGAADTLMQLKTPSAPEAQLHESVMDKGVMRMRPVASLSVPARSRIELKPGGLHVMLVNLQRPLSEGDRFALTLVFARAGAVTVEVAVQGLGAMEPPA